MKAPDKIKIVRFSDTKELSDYWVLENKTKNEDIEYIRKDALLEWAKEAHDSGPIKDSADKGDAWSIGYLCSTADLIDRLNTL